MAVRDVETDRLHVAQRAIELLGQQLSGGRVGLTLFGGSSVLRYPLTASTKIVGPALDTSGHGFHVQPGSSLQAALDGAAAQFPTTAADDLRTRAIVVVSDGEDPVPDLPVLDPYLARGIHVFTLGIGTPAVVASLAAGRGEYLRRPDLGRQPAGMEMVPASDADIGIVLADGLSARALVDHAEGLLAALVAECASLIWSGSTATR